MEPGTIKKLLRYYFTNPKFEREISRALNEFFGDDAPIVGDGEIQFRSEEENSLFNEWFVYDFKLSNGKTPLEDFYYRNPYHLKIDRLQIYKDLQENVYSYFKVIKKILGSGLVLEDIINGKIYEVKEYSLTFEVFEGQSFPTRVGRVGDHYEIVGGNIYVMPMKLSPELELFFKKSRRNWNPKKVWEEYIKTKGPRPSLDGYPTLPDAEADLNFILKKYDLDKFVSTALIKEWIYDEMGDIDQLIALLMSLLDPKRIDYENTPKEILEKLNKFHNLCPKKRFNGKSPFDMMKEAQEKGLLPDFKFGITKILFPEIHKKYHDFLESITERNDYRGGLKKINKIFKFMLEKRISYPELYRLYANKAICHLALGNFEKGKFFLEIAVKLNPYYKFARRQLEKVKESGFVWEVYVDGYIEKDPAYQYYLFILPFRINFAHEVDEVIV